MTETGRVIVRDDGFHDDDWQGTGALLELAAECDPAQVGLDPAPGLIRVAFAHFADGRGFSIARSLRARGYAGRLRAAGHVIADQYAMARRSGFDEVEIDAALAARQPEAQWRARADWRAYDYQARLRAPA